MTDETQNDGTNVESTTENSATPENAPATNSEPQVESGETSQTEPASDSAAVAAESEPAATEGDAEPAPVEESAATAPATDEGAPSNDAPAADSTAPVLHTVTFSGAITATVSVETGTSVTAALAKAGGDPNLMLRNANNKPLAKKTLITSDMSITTVAQARGG